jgi:hypothetical protein
LYKKFYIFFIEYNNEHFQFYAIHKPFPSNGFSIDLYLYSKHYGNYNNIKIPKKGTKYIYENNSYDEDFVVKNPHCCTPPSLYKISGTNSATVGVNGNYEIETFLVNTDGIHMKTTSKF